MSKNRYVNTHFWKDNFTSELDPSEKLLFLYFLTNPSTTICGAYEIRLKEIALDTGFEVEMVKKILARFEAAGKVYYRDGWVYISNFIKHQKINPNIEKGIISAVSGSPDWIKQKVMEDYGKASEGFESLSKALNYLNLNLNSNSNTNANEPGGAIPSATVADEETSDSPNETFDSAKEEYLTATREVFNTNILSKEERWLKEIENAILAGISSAEFIAELKTLLADKTRKYPITPENVLTAAIERRARNKPVIKTTTPNKPTISRAAQMEARGFPAMKVSTTNQ